MFQPILCLVGLLMAGTLYAQPLPSLELPRGAQDHRTTVIEKGVWEQDWFWLTAVYPSNSAADHYAKALQGWHRCLAQSDDWSSFGDYSQGEPRFIHQATRYWVNRTNSQAVILALRYTSEGASSRARPDNDRQVVVVIKHRLLNAKAFLAEIGVRCPSQPNLSLHPTRTSYARAVG